MTARCPELLPDGSRCVLDAGHGEFTRRWVRYPHQSSTAYTRELGAEMVQNAKNYLAAQETSERLYREEIERLNARIAELEAELARLKG